MQVLINIQEAIFFKLPEIGITDFNMYLLKREDIEIIPLENTVKEYIVYSDNFSTLNEDTEVGSSSINVKDNTIYNIGETIRIKNFVAEIIDLDSSNNIYLNKKVDNIYLTGENVNIVLYPDLLNSYYATFNYDKVGNYNLVITNKDKNIFIVKNIDFISEQDKEVIVTNCMTAY